MLLNSRLTMWTVSSTSDQSIKTAVKTATVWHFLPFRFLSFYWSNRYRPSFRLSSYRKLFDLSSHISSYTKQIAFWFLIRLLRITYKQLKLCIYKRRRRRKKNEEVESEETRNENYVRTFVTVEKNKTKFTNSIVREYKEKVILFGLIVMFACSFSLGPLIFIIIAMIDMRVDAFRFLLMFQRPVGYRAQDIGAWFNITRFLNVVGIITNGFIIGFTSRWSIYFLNDNNTNRLIFVAAFEVHKLTAIRTLMKTHDSKSNLYFIKHVVFFLWILIIIIFPHVPRHIKHKMRKVSPGCQPLLIKTSKGTFKMMMA